MNKKQDQQTMSVPEWKKKRGIQRAFKNFFAGDEDCAKDLLESKWSNQSVNRVEKSARRAKRSFLAQVLWLTEQK